MYLVGDRILLPSPYGGDVCGTVSLVEEQPDGSLAYVVNGDNSEIFLRYSSEDHETSFVNNIDLDFL